MFVRRLQLVAGTTYTVSLPKQWVLANKLSSGSNVSMHVRGDQSLLLSSNVLSEDSSLTRYEIDIDTHAQSIDQMLFGLFYVGFEEIALTSKTRMTPSTKATIKHTLSYMTGTEIVHEDDRSIHLKVFLAPERLESGQLLNRVALIITTTINILKEGGDVEAVALHETEVDRLYHLLTKLVYLSLLRPGTLQSSGIEYTTNAIPFMLIAKRLEHLMDSLNRLAPHITRRPAGAVLAVLDFIEASVKRSSTWLVQHKAGHFERTERRRVQALRHRIRALRTEQVRRHIANALRCAIDVEEEVMNLSFYKELVNEGLL